MTETRWLARRCPNPHRQDKSNLGLTELVPLPNSQNADMLRANKLILNTCINSTSLYCVPDHNVAALRGGGQENREMLL